MKKERGAKKAKEPETELRRRAWERMKKGTTDISGIPADDVKALLQELEIHQVELEIQNEDLREAQVELAEARDSYVDLYESSPVGLLSLDQGLVIGRANMRAAKMLGVDRSRLVGSRVETFVTKESADSVYLAIREALVNECELSYDAEFQRPDGSRFFGRLAVSPLDGSRPEIRIALSDISETREAQRQRDETLAQLDTLYRTAPVGLCLLDRELRYVRVNERLAEINGIPAEEHIGRTIREMVPQFAELGEKLGERALRTGEPVLNQEFEGETAGKPGVQRTWVEAWYPLKDARGEVQGVSVSVREITELKRAQEELQVLNDELEQRVEERTRQLEESRNWYRQRVESIPHKVWSILPDGTGEYCNQRTLDYLGMTLEDMNGWHWNEVIHSEDLERLSAELSEMLRSGRRAETEMRIRRGTDGAYRWHAAHAAPMFDDRGRIVRWLGTCTDIHERRMAEQTLQQMSRIFQDSAVPILVQEEEGHVVHMNDEVARVFGWSREDLVGRSLKTLLPPESYDAFDMLLDRCRKDPSQPERLEMVMLTQEGSPVPVLVTLSVLTSNPQDPGALTALIAKDIRQIKRAEEALRASERALREEKKKLEEKNTALREILEQVEWEKTKIREDVAAHLEEYALPLLDRLAERGENSPLVQTLRRSLEDLSSPLGRRLSENSARLTPKEKELCRLLKGGLTSKEVARIMNCSPQTIEKHRKNIRKKFGIVGTSTNLGAYLNGI